MLPLFCLLVHHLCLAILRITLILFAFPQTIFLPASMTSRLGETL